MKKITTSLLIILGILILLEVYLRIFHYETLKTRVRDLAYIPDSLYGFRHKPNSEQVFIWPGISKKFRFNNHGFYGSDFSENKDNDSYRIIFVGNSTTLGLRTDGEKNFVMKLQDLLKQANYNVEIINCSVDGKDRDIENMNIVKFITPKYHPDLVMFKYKFPLTEQHVMRDVYKDYMLRYISYNCSDSIRIRKAKIDKIYSAKFLCKIYDASFIIRAFCHWLDNHRTHPFASFFNLHILRIEYVTSYIKKEIGRGDKIDVFTKEQSRKMYSDLEKYLDSLKIKFATYSIFRTKLKPDDPNNPKFPLDLKANKELSIKEEGHLNEKGHDMIAKALFFKLTHSSLALDNYKIK